MAANSNSHGQAHTHTYTHTHTHTHTHTYTDRYSNRESEREGEREGEGYHVLRLSSWISNTYSINKTVWIQGRSKVIICEDIRSRFYQGRRESRQGLERDPGVYYGYYQ